MFFEIQQGKPLLSLNFFIVASKQKSLFVQTYNILLIGEIFICLSIGYETVVLSVRSLEGAAQIKKPTH